MTYPKVTEISRRSEWEPEQIVPAYQPHRTLLCDERGETAVCQDGCGQLHSPYWLARKSKALHESGCGHRVIVQRGIQSIPAVCPKR